MAQKLCDQFNFSKKIIMILFAVTLLILSLLFVDNRLRNFKTDTEQIINSLNLNNLSLVPSGRPLRHPEGIIDSVNLNYSPSLCSIVINPEHLLLVPPAYPKDEIIP